MMVVTGAAGFIGSCTISRLNEENFNYIIAVDDFSNKAKNKNLVGKKIKKNIHRDQFFGWLEKNWREVEFILHLGARTDTTESDWQIFETLNLAYSKRIWNACCQYYIPLIYASSAATYGINQLKYDDNEKEISKLQPMNLYGKSKNDFDNWVLEQKNKPFFWIGLKFFNVFGPNEYHKGRMASVAFHAFNQIKQTRSVKLFRSHRKDFDDGKQQRDFIYIKDITEVILFLIHHRKNSGIYNLGSGKAKTFLDLVRFIFKTLNQRKNIIFIDTPEDIREEYQYFTEANMQKLRSIGYTKSFSSLEESIKDYINNYLSIDQYF